MRRLKLIGAFLCVLAAWMQFLSPVAAMSMQADGAPFAVICAKVGTADTVDKGSSGSPQAPASHHDHKHCSLCQTHVSVAPPVERPVFTVFDYPVAGPLRWRLTDTGVTTSARHAIFQPRAPPRPL